MSEQPEQQINQDINISDNVLNSVQIGGIAGRDLKSTQIQGKVWLFNIFGTIQVPQAPLDAAKPLSRDEHRWRKILLSKVKQFWIEGVLENLLHRQIMIELGLEGRTDYVSNPLEGIEELPTDSRSVFPKGTSASDIFEDIGDGRTLLILGEPGAGKTVTLLKLAESLVHRTSEDLSQPLPVVVNLSSWAKQRKTIDEWLIQELWDIYKVTKTLGKAWIVNEQLILLFDGLDEVEAQHRNGCVNAINQFVQTHGRTEIVVCSRIRDYEALTQKLSLRSAIYIQPLTPREIDQYLEKIGKPFLNLQSILNENPDIRNFASSPLILSIMSLAYKESYSEDFLQIASEISPKRLFDIYINSMFKRRNTNQYYRQEHARHWLVWLAQYLVQNSQTVFFIERIQPSYLWTGLQKFKYRLESGLISGVIVGLIRGLVSGLLLGLHGGLSIGLISGVSIGLLENIRTVETIRWSWKAAIESYSFGFNYGLFIWLIIGLFIGSNAVLSYGIFYTIIGVLITVLIGALVTGLIGSLIGGFRGPEVEPQNKLMANSGLRKSAIHALIFGLIGGLFFGLFFGLLFKLNSGLFLGQSVGLKHGLLFGLVGGILSGLIGGGAACLQHFTLRFRLYRMGYIPWNYARFLDYAADRLFLQKVGGGYIFIHRMLLEHFASMDLEPHHREALPNHE